MQREKRRWTAKKEPQGVYVSSTSQPNQSTFYIQTEEKKNLSSFIFHVYGPDWEYNISISEEDVRCYFIKTTRYIRLISSTYLFGILQNFFLALFHSPPSSSPSSSSHHHDIIVIEFFIVFSSFLVDDSEPNQRMSERTSKFNNYAASR